MGEGSDHLEITVETTGDTARIKLDGELDIHTAPGVAEAITGALDAGASTVVVDAAALRFCDSSGIQVLVQARERLVGSFVGGFLANALFQPGDQEGFGPAGIIGSILGAIVVLLIVRAVGRSNAGGRRGLV